MTLSFKTYWDKYRPTYFVEKIWAGLLLNNISDEFTLKQFERKRVDLFKRGITTKHQYPKIHTIREDKHNRWRKGMKINFVINNRTKNRFEFAPFMPCTSIQYIQIEWTSINLSKLGMIIKVDEKILSYSEALMLARNDGFDSIQDFVKWFNKPFIGKIIHWTNFKY